MLCLKTHCIVMDAPLDSLSRLIVMDPLRDVMDESCDVMDAVCCRVAVATALIQQPLAIALIQPGLASSLPLSPRNEYAMSHTSSWHTTGKSCRVYGWGWFEDEVHRELAPIGHVDSSCSIVNCV